MSQEPSKEPGRAEPTLEGRVVSDADRRVLLEAMDQAFDYRGDVTLTLDDGARLTGYIFDRRRGPDAASSFVRLLCAGSEDRISVPYSRIRALEFSGRDTAAGKSFETWVRKYVEKKLAGQKASIESEPLE